MSQYILILVSALILGMLGFNRHQAQALDQRAEMVREIESAALLVAERWSGHARDLAFDEADIGSAEVRLRGDITGLTTTLGPDAGEIATNAVTFDDVDDFSGFAVADTARVGRGIVGAITFDVSMTATYAEPGTWAPATSPTTAKVVTVTVREAATVERGRPPVELTIPVRLTPAQQFSYR